MIAGRFIQYSLSVDVVLRRRLDHARSRGPGRSAVPRTGRSRSERGHRRRRRRRSSCRTPPATAAMGIADDCEYIRSDAVCGKVGQSLELGGEDANSQLVVAQRCDRHRWSVGRGIERRERLCELLQERHRVAGADAAHLVLRRAAGRTRRSGRLGSSRCTRCSPRSPHGWRSCCRTRRPSRRRSVVRRARSPDRTRAASSELLKTMSNSLPGHASRPVPALDRGDRQRLRTCGR